MADFAKSPHGLYAVIYTTGGITGRSIAHFAHEPPTFADLEQIESQIASRNGWDRCMITNVFPVSDESIGEAGNE